MCSPVICAFTDPPGDLTHEAVGELLVSGGPQRATAFFFFQDIMHRDWYKKKFLKIAFYLLANKHGLWHIPGDLNLKVLLLQGDWAPPAKTVPPVARQVLLVNRGDEKALLRARGQTWDLLWPQPAKPACGSGNQDKTRFPHTKLELRIRLVILDSLSREECYQCTDLHTGLYETELKPYGLPIESHYSWREQRSDRMPVLTLA